MSRVRPTPLPPGLRRRHHGGFIITGTLALLALAAAAGALLLGLLALWWASDLPSLDEAIDYRPRQHLEVLSADGVPLAQFGTERRIFVPIAKVPQRMKDAVLAVEDAQFYEHGGISFKGLLRATWANLSGGTTQGASTITQQLARTMFLSTRRTAERKGKEAMLALQLESRLSKDEILELYLNEVFLGQRAYGVGAAAQAYFGKTLDQLTLAETAMIAGLPQNPIRANPVSNLERAQRRQRWVLHRMRVTGVITEAEHDAAVAEKITLRRTRGPDLVAQHVAEMARQAVVERLGERAYTEGVRVFTSIRADDQRAAHAALRRAVMAHERRQRWRGPEEQNTLPAEPEAALTAAAQAMKDLRDDEDLRLATVLSVGPRELTALLASGETVQVGADALKWVQAALRPDAAAALAIRRGSVLRLEQQVMQRGQPPQWRITQWPEADGAFVALHPETGRVRALVGGFDFRRQQFNRVTQAARQPGSSFKPFLYSAALEHGVMPETLVNDAPLTDADGSPAAWNPRNSDGRFDGPITVRQGLVQSKNLVSVRLLQQIGLAQARPWIARFGLPMEQQPQDLTFALGTGSVTPMQMATAYAVLANGGHRVRPVLIERIVDGQGQVLFQAPPPPALGSETRVLPERNVFITNTMLSDVTLRGTAARAKATLQRPDLYGKTGTTNDAVDAWFAGWAPGAVAVAWMGHDQPRSLGDRESGGGLALPIWIDTMRTMLRGVPVQPLAPPGGVSAVGGDWRYDEWAGGLFVPSIDVPDEVLDALAAERAQAAASAPEGGASAPR